ISAGKLARRGHLVRGLEREIDLPRGFAQQPRLVQQRLEALGRAELTTFEQEQDLLVRFAKLVERRQRTCAHQQERRISRRRTFLAGNDRERRRGIELLDQAARLRRQLGQTGHDEVAAQKGMSSSLMPPGAPPNSSFGAGLPSLASRLAA